MHLRRRWQERQRRFARAAALLLAAGLLVAGCGSGAPSGQNGGTGGSGTSQGGQIQPGGTLNIAMTGDIVSLDPAFAYDFTTNQVVDQMTEGLLKFDAQGHVQPNLAESVENPDPTTYIYHLRKDVKFWDGNPMTADDVVYSMQRVMDPKTASYVGWMYGNVDKVVKVDDYTVKVTLKQPDAFWQYVPATTAGHVVEKKWMESHPKAGKPEEGIMGTGPFMYVSWTPGQEIVLKKNPNYWDKSAGGPYLDKLVYHVIPDGTTIVAGLKTGEIDFAIDAVPSDQLALVQKMDNVALKMITGDQVNYVAFNNSREPFTDPKIRQALNYLIDRKAIVDKFAHGASDPAGPTLVTPGLWTLGDRSKWEEAYKALPDYSYNPEKAKELLKQSSRPNGFSFKLLVDPDPVRTGAAVQLQAEAEKIGIHIQIEKVTWQQLATQLLGKKDYDAAMDIWGSDFPDPAGNLFPTFLSTNTGDGGSNQVLYKNPKVDELLHQQNGLTDPEQRAEILRQVQSIIAEDVPMIAIDYPKQTLAINKKVSGYDFSALWYWDAYAKNLHFTK